MPYPGFMSPCLYMLSDCCVQTATTKLTGYPNAAIPNCWFMMDEQGPVSRSSQCASANELFIHYTLTQQQVKKHVFFFFTLVKETAHPQPTLHQIKISSPAEDTAHHSPPSLTPSWRVLWFPEYGPWGSRAWTFQWGTGCGGPSSAPGRTPGTRAGTGHSTAAALLQHREIPQWEDSEVIPGWKESSTPRN